MEVKKLWAKSLKKEYLAPPKPLQLRECRRRPGVPRISRFLDRRPRVVGLTRRVRGLEARERHVCMIMDRL